MDESGSEKLEVLGLVKIWILRVGSWENVLGILIDLIIWYAFVGCEDVFLGVDMG